MCHPDQNIKENNLSVNICKATPLAVKAYLWSNYNNGCGSYHDYNSWI